MMVPPRDTAPASRPACLKRSTDSMVTPQCSVRKSTPCSQCCSITSNISSGVIWRMDFLLFLALTAISYSGTVPTATGHSPMIVFRIAARSPLVERSMMASAPYLMAMCIFSSSSAMSTFADEVPMFAFIFIRVPGPMASGSISRFALRAITMEPSETAFRTCSAGSPSFFAAFSTSGVIIPFFA